MPFYRGDGVALTPWTLTNFGLIQLNATLPAGGGGGGGGGSGARPDATNTGWQRTGVSLLPWNGPTTLVADQLIENRLINDDLFIQSAVTIRRCQINGRIDCDGAAWSLLLEDCNVNAGTWTSQAVGFGNLTIRRCNIVGGSNSVIGGGNITIEDSWLHDQYLASNLPLHENAFITNGGSNIVLRNCVLHADEPDNAAGGGVSTNCSLFGDFAPLSDILIEDCFFPATPGAYGVSLGYNPQKPFGSNPTNITFRNNMFQRGPTGNCGIFGPVTSWLPGNGNVFEGNVWEDGSPLTGIGVPAGPPPAASTTYGAGAYGSGAYGN